MVYALVAADFTHAYRKDTLGRAEFRVYHL
jgi:hypothetical protein